VHTSHCPGFHIPEYDHFEIDQQYGLVDNKAWMITRQQFTYYSKTGKEIVRRERSLLIRILNSIKNSLKIFRYRIELHFDRRLMNVTAVFGNKQEQNH
jgi:hypothetical protein